MSHFKRIVLATALLGALAAPAFANDREGDVTVYARTGGTQVMRVADKAMLNEITKGLTPLDDHAMVVMNEGKFYLVNDKKMSNGKMISQILSPRESVN